MDDVAIAYWTSVATGGPVIGLALVLEARWVQSQWTGAPRWVKVPASLVYAVVALGVAFSSGIGLGVLGTGSDMDRRYTAWALACGLGLVLLTPVMNVVSDAFKRDAPVGGGREDQGADHTNADAPVPQLRSQRRRARRR